MEQYNTVCQVLEEIGATDNKRLIVLNKTDQLEKLDLRRTSLQNSFPNAIEVSAITGAGLPQLMEAIAQELAGEVSTYKIPLSQARLLEQIRQQGVILEEQWLDTHIHLKARPGSSKALQAQLETYKED